MPVARVMVMFALTGCICVDAIHAQDWDRADAATVRLSPSAFPNIPPAIRTELRRRGCRIPQNFFSKTPHNVVRGRLTSASQEDVAVLCSIKRVSRILVFRGGSSKSVMQLASVADRSYLQVVGANNEVGYSRAIDVVGVEFIRAHENADADPLPRVLEHDGIEDIFVEKGSSVRYWYRDRWLRLAGVN